MLRKAVPLLIILAPGCDLFCTTPDTPTPTAATSASTGDTGNTGTTWPAGTVRVTVQAQDPNGHALTYQWRATDGSITDRDASSTLWELPPGRGIHYAYVLVSNGQGGYTEGRVSVNTDDWGTDIVVPPPVGLLPPAGPAVTTGQLTGRIRSGRFDGGIVSWDGVYLPDVPVAVHSPATGWTSDPVRTDLRGRFAIDGIPPGDYVVRCDTGQGGHLCVETDSQTIPIGVEGVNVPNSGSDPDRGTHVGRALLADGTPCGIANELFGVHATGEVALLDAAGKVVEGPYRLHVAGHFSLAGHPDGEILRLTCEGAAPVELPATEAVDLRAEFVDTGRPRIRGMTADPGDGVDVGTWLEPEDGPASRALWDPEHFLSAKGLDSRVGACRYYQAIGAVRGCDSDGTFVDPISFDEWMRQAEIGPYVRSGFTELEAHYANLSDVYVVRDQHSISYGPDEVAAYVCNHAGPADDTQAALDQAIEDSLRGRNRVACAALDFRAWSTGANGGQPFLRFLLFGPSGELLPSTNNDGRGEKFLPGVCVGCHGGTHYAGRFPRQAAGAHADVGGYFLPYDVEAFSFSSAPGLRQEDVEPVLKKMNRNVLDTRPTAAVTELVQGWYAAGGAEQDATYLPPSWAKRPKVEQDFYHHVYAKSCRTCHVVFKEALNFDHHENVFFEDPQATELEGLGRLDTSMCGGSAAWVRNFSMPNTQRLLDAFWASSGTAEDQPALFDAFVASVVKSSGQSCELQASPHP